MYSVRHVNPPVRAMRLILWAVAAVMLLAPSPHSAMAIRIVTYNLLNYSGSRADEYKTVLNEVQPDVIVVQEMLNGWQTTFLTDVLNAVDGPGGPGGAGSYDMATYTSGPDTNNALYYRTTVITYPGSADGGHIDLMTFPRRVDRWRLTLHDYTVEQVHFYVYSMHLKAGTDGSDEDARHDAAIIVRADANDLPTDTNFIYAGDFNVYYSAEDAYQELIESQGDNDGRGFDPLDTPGNWHDSDPLQWVHTQSTHRNNSGAPSGAATGGLDDRFDFLLISAALNDDDGLSYVRDPGDTYKPYGNDGQHLNDDINDNPEIPEGWDIANALHGASDHLPVLMDVQAPAAIPYIPWVNFGAEVIVGDVAVEDLTVSNSGDLDLFGYVDDLEYTLDFDGPSDFAAPGGTFADAAGGGGNVHDITMDTSTSGSKSDLLHINNNSPDMPVRNVTVIGTVYDRGDLSRTNGVDFADVEPFINVLLDPDAASEFDRRLADMDENTINDGRDIQGFVDALLP